MDEYRIVIIDGEKVVVEIKNNFNQIIEKLKDIGEKYSNWIIYKNDKVIASKGVNAEHVLKVSDM